MNTKRILKYLFSGFIILISNCQSSFQNVGDPSTLIGIIYSYDTNQLLTKSEASIIYSEIPTSMEEGTSVEVSIRLSKSIGGEKNITISSDNPNLTINDNASKILTFNSGDATIEQRITLKAIQDDSSISSQKANLKISSSWQEDIDFDIIVRNTTTQSIVVTNEAININEGETKNVYIHLLAAPANNIIVNISSDNESLLKTDVPSITFTSENYNIPQAVQLQAIENDLYLFDKKANISFTLDTGETITKEITVISNNIEYKDLSAGQGYGSGYYPDITLDNGNSKILVVTRNGDNSNKPGLFRCDLEGNNCIYSDISVAQGTDSGNYPVIDTVNSKLLVVTRNGDNSNKPGLFRCDLDGSNCIYTDISAGQGSNSGKNPDVAIDTINSKLLVVSENGDNSNKPGLFRCDLDGSNCTYTDISAGQGSSSGLDPVMTIDYLNSKILVITRDSSDTFNRKLSLFRCNLDGSNCKHIVIANVYIRYPAVTIDEIRSKLVIAATNYDDDRTVSIYTCELDGTSCKQNNTSSSGQGYGSGYEPSIAIDSSNGMIHVATRNDFNANQLGYYRCDLNTFECVHKDISQIRGDDSGNNPKIILDEVNSKVLIVARDDTNEQKPVLYRFPKDFLE